MAEWVYDEGEWNRTRVVEVFQAADGMYYWRRSRIRGGVSGKVVAVSGGFIEELQARISAVKENYPLLVGPVAEPPIDVPPGDPPVDPDVPPGPEPGEPPEDEEEDEGGATSKSRATKATPDQKKQVSGK